MVRAVRLTMVRAVQVLQPEAWAPQCLLVATALPVLLPSVRELVAVVPVPVVRAATEA